MTSLITGMAGFAGRHLASLLREKGEECLGFDHPETQRDDPACRALDILEEQAVTDAVAEIKPDFVYHLAAQSGVAKSWTTPVNTFQINVLGTLNLLKAIQIHVPNTRLVLVSTGEVYGRPRPDGKPLTEDERPFPQNPYALSKLGAELYATLYQRMYGLDVVRARPLGHTGPGQAQRFVAPDFAAQIAAIEKGLKPPIIKVGNLDAKREFMYVRDVARAYVLLAKKGENGQVYNVASGKLYSVKEMLDTLLEISGADIKVEVDPERFRPLDSPALQLDSSKIASLTGWKPEFSMRETLTLLLEHSRKELASS